MSTWHAIGTIRWPLAASLLVILVLIASSAVKLFGSDATADPRTKVWLDAILFWGGFALVTGVLGTLVGIILAAQSIEQAGAAQTSMVWGGIRVALLSAVVGLVILSFSGLGWFLLQLRWRLLASEFQSTV